jgi:hypothetical protein
MSPPLHGAPAKVVSVGEFSLGQIDFGVRRHAVLYVALERSQM